jgi:TonB-linked SusC/RagA family outer membrane protein
MNRACIIWLSAILFVSIGVNEGFSQNSEEVSGTVTTAETGESLPGVNIRIVGTKTGTTTNSNGEYSISVPTSADSLIFSFIGFSTQNIAINGRDQIDVELISKTFTGEEMVVVGFGEQKKSSLVSSITTVKPDDIDGPTTNLTQMMSGQVPGMIAFQRSGAPGVDNSDFFIRGLGTFGSGKRNPLILIDGIESTQTDMARLQPDDIESFSVLKDATAAAVYGARGANGVVVIKTKTGQAGEAKFKFRSEARVTTNTKNFNLANNIDYMELANEAALTRDPNAVLPYSRNKIDRTREGANELLYPSNNWIDELIRDYTVNQSYNLSAQGGGERVKYYVSGTYGVDNGNLKVAGPNNFNNNIKLQNYSVRSNINLNLTETTEGIIRVYGQFDDYNGPVGRDDQPGGGDDIYESAIQSNPVRFPAVYPSSFRPFVEHPLFGGATAGQGGNTILSNPYAQMVRGYQTWKRSNIQPQIELRQDLEGITQGLRVRAMGYLQRKSYFDVAREYNPFYYDGTIVPGQEEVSLRVLNDGGINSIGQIGTEFLNYNEGEKEVSSKIYLETVANYDRTFADRHDVSGMLIGLMSSFQTGNAGSVQNSLQQRNMGISGRFSYAYDERYHAEFNFGFNGSERFAVSNRYGFFPSFGLAYNISNEKFFNPLSGTISNFKLRASFGFLGNDEIGLRTDRFFYLSNVNLNNGTYGATFGQDLNYYRNGISVNRYANPNITWEKSREINLGFDLSLFDSSLELIADIYRQNRTNILQTRSNLGPSLGLASVPSANTGEAMSEGIDLALSYQKQVNNNWFARLRSNFTYASSEVVDFDEVNYPPGLAYRSQEGNSISQAYGYIAERLFVDDAEVANSPQQFGEYRGGDIKYYDVNGDGAITGQDQVPLGHPTVPEIVYGFGGTVSYKTFDVSVFFQGSARTSFFINSQNISPFVINGSAQNGLLDVIADDHWSEGDRDPYAFWPRLSDEFITNNNRTSSWWLRDGSFLRLKQAEIGYSVPRQLLEKLNLRDVRIYASGLNLAVWSKFDMWDPEMGGNGLGYPIQSTYNFGIEVDL